MGVIQEKVDVLGGIAYGPFVLTPAACTVAGGGRLVHLDPRAMDVLCVMAAEPGRVFSEDELERFAWPRGGHGAAKAIERLRPKLETLSPNMLSVSADGYGLSPDPVLADPAPVVRAPRKPWVPEAWRPKTWHLVSLAAAAVVLAVPVAATITAPIRQDSAVVSSGMVDTADEDYFHYSYEKNEQAIALYQRAIRRDPDNARAHAGLANALVQRVMRWPHGDAEGAKTFTKLEDALKAGYVDQPKSQQVLRRAMRMAQRAVKLNVRDAAAHKALAFVHSAQRNFDDALNGYKRAVALDPDAWGPMINIGDILEIQGRSAEAVPYFEKAYETMARVYGAQTVRVRPWHSELGIHIGDAYRARGELKQSAQWYRKVLDGAPLHPGATGRLASVLQQTGDEQTARELCAALKSRLGDKADCSS
jgi:transcriptional activator of cad operon